VGKRRQQSDFFGADPRWRWKRRSRRSVAISRQRQTFRMPDHMPRLVAASTAVICRSMARQTGTIDGAGAAGPVGVDRNNAVAQVAPVGVEDHPTALQEQQGDARRCHAGNFRTRNAAQTNPIAHRGAGGQGSMAPGLPHSPRLDAAECPGRVEQRTAAAAIRRPIARRAPAVISPAHGRGRC